MLPWDPLWRLRHVGYPVSPRGYRGLPAFASLSMAGSERVYNITGLDTYGLMEGIRRLALKGTKLARAQVTTIRLKLLKVGAVILRNTRRVRFLLSSAYPHQQLFLKVAARLRPT